MNQSAEVLSKLIKIALGNEKELSLHNVVNWQEVFDLANRQGVVALAWTEQLSDQREQLGLSEDLMYKWIGHQVVVEEENVNKFQALKRLGGSFASIGLRPVILKGLSYAVLYPNMYHRKCSDLDVFLFDRWEEGNAIVEKEGIKVNRGFYKNSSFTYQGLFVENHKYCTPIRGQKQKKKYELLLQELLENAKLEKIHETDFLTPPPLFNILFFLSHAQIHFLFEGGIQLRHVCDWCVIMKAYSNENEDLWNEAIYYSEQFGLIKFMYSMSQVAQEVCGMSIPFLCPINKKADNALIEEILLPTCDQVDFSSGWKTRKQLVKSIIQSRWKFKLFSEQSMLMSLAQSIIFFLIEKNPELKRN